MGATESTRKTAAGKLGLSLSLLCSIHCLAMPFVIAFLPAGGAFFQNPVIEVLLLGSCILLASYTLIRDYRHLHHNYGSLLLLGIGIILLLAGQANHAHGKINFIAPLAGLAIFGAYFLNWRHIRRYHHSGADCGHQHSH